MKKQINNIVTAVRKKLAINSNLGSRKIEFTKYYKQMDINPCDINTITNLVFLA